MSTDHSLPAIYMYYLAQLVPRWKVQPAAIVEGTGLAVADLAEPGASLPIDQIIEVVERARALAGEPALGFFLGMQMKISWHGYLGFAAMSAPTIGAALELGTRFAPTRTSALGLRLERPAPDRSDPVALVIEERAPLGEARDAILIALVVGLWQVGNAMTGRNLTGSVDFAFPQPSYFGPFAAGLAATVRFDRPDNRMMFAAEVLDLPLAMADPGALELARRECERELDEVTGASGVVGQVRELIAGAVGRTIDDVARELGMSARTLKRRLAEYDTSYTTLVTEARRSLATRLLATDESIERIADRVGYADAQSFARAFRRWTGMAPTDYRRLVR